MDDDNIVVNFDYDMDNDDYDEEEEIIKIDVEDEEDEEYIDEEFEDDDIEEEIEEEEKPEPKQKVTKPKEKKPILKRLMVGTLTIGILIFAFSGIQGFGQPRYMRIVNTDIGFSFNHDDEPSFYSNDSAFFFQVTRTSIRKLGSNAENRWSEMLFFSRPIMVSRGNIVAVGEDRGRVINVFNENGHLFSSTFEYPVLSFSVTETGFLTVILQLDVGIRVQVHGEHHTNPNFLFRNDIHSPLLHPVSAEMAANGRYVVITFLDMQNHIDTIVQFYFTREEDAWATDRGLFSQVPLLNEMPIHTRIMNNNRVLVITDMAIRAYDIGPGNNTPLVWERALTNRLEHIEFLHGSHFAIALGERIPGVLYAPPPNTVQVFNMNNVQTTYIEMDRRISQLHMSNNAVVIGTDRFFIAKTLAGDILWEYVALHDVRDFLLLENTNTFLVVGAARAEVWRRQRVRDEITIFD